MTNNHTHPHPPRAEADAMTLSERTTQWHCDGCQQSGSVTHAIHAGVIEVYTQLMDNHRATSPVCEGGRYEIRVPPTPSAEG